MLTIPNAISFARLALIPYFWWVLVGQNRLGLAAALIFLIGGTDWVDGYLARRLHQESKLGAMLDPVADRLMIGSALVGGMIVGALPLWFGLLTVGREVVVSIVAVVSYFTGNSITVSRVGKVATFMLYGAIPSFYLVSADIAPWIFGPPAWISGVLGLIIYWYAAIGYLTEMRRRIG